MLEVRSLSKTYPARGKAIAAVAEVELDVAPGEFVAVVGRSGSGKSTLLGMIGGQSRPTAGTVLFQGRDVWGLSAGERAEYRRRQVGFVFQFPALLPMLRVVDNVALPALLGRGGDLAATYARAQELLHLVGLADRLEDYPDELSGGQQRRVAAARALVNRPPLLLADEPTAELDPESERELFAALVDLHRRYQAALVVVTHSPALARQADRVVHLKAGRIVSTEHRPAAVVNGSATPNREPDPPGLDGDGPASPLPVPPVDRILEPLGSGWQTFVGTLGVWLTLAALTVATLNYGASLWQRRAVEERRIARATLEDLALQQVRAEVSDVAYGPDDGYVVKVSAVNLQPDQELYLTTPTVRVFVQVGREWREAPARPHEAEGRVVRLTNAMESAYTIRPKIADFEEQLAGYMHVRIVAGLLLARSREPGDEIVERVDDFYIYLKPHGADDAEISRRNRWSSKPPLWIPMPSH
ncbi:MAG: ATP-binding cassette domain-containing protein [Planctomycetia bacterium]